MPPKVRYSKEAIAEAAFSIARAQGMDAVNARAIAKALGCSTQPLFRVFENMEQLRGAVRKLAGECYVMHQLAAMQNAEKPYKASGISYVRFAAKEPELFKLLFMYDREQSVDGEEDDPSLLPALQGLMQSTSMTLEQAKQFHLGAWIFVHGMASMIATRYVSFTDEEIEAHITAYYEGATLRYERTTLP